MGLLLYLTRLPSFLCRLPSRLRRKARRRRLGTMLLLALILLALLLPLIAIYKPPAFLIRYFQRRWPDVLWTVPTTQPVVALTIDDAPSEYTPGIAHLLEENAAHATFFVIGAQVQGRERTLQDLVTQGHELGNHAMHDEASARLGDGELEAQIQTVDKLIANAYAGAGAMLPRRYFRPGSGVFSKRMRALVKKLGFRIVLGSVYPHDAQVGYARVNAWHVLSGVKPGAIVVCHDRRGWTGEMLGIVLPELKRRGYRVVTVSELLRIGGVD
ncbi:nodulation protein nodB [Trichodelitschia bisporula]|uniref:chitin deacetylase n=1 Tax=Trichodelitschia bisporula TaxID=703511 RepID=A0A6G1HRB2_9PEZI|nr:nodulation protein nodB [Trichodelitschia bisporula]